jgi:hypothetical protein
MGARRPWLVLALLLAPAAARAGDHKFDVFTGASYLRAKGSTIELGGWHVSGAATMGEEYTWLGVVGDLSVHFLGGDGTDLTTDRTQITFMVGPRITPLRRGHRLHKLFGHVMLLGAVHSYGKPMGGTTSAAIALGGGFDFTPGEDETWGGRLQVDYVLPVSSDLGHGWRVSAGAVYRFHFHGEPSPTERRP